MRRCAAEMCGSWTGDGCACAVYGIEPDLTLSCEMQDHPDEGDGCCACGKFVYFYDDASGSSARSGVTS